MGSKDGKEDYEHVRWKGKNIRWDSRNLGGIPMGYIASEACRTDPTVPSFSLIVWDSAKYLHSDVGCKRHPCI